MKAVDYKYGVMAPRREASIKSASRTTNNITSFPHKHPVFFNKIQNPNHIQLSKTYRFVEGRTLRLAMPSQSKIAIIGAGPAGLTLARLLQRNELTCTIFELDASPEKRDQGGSLDLHPQDGQLALKEAGLFEQFLQHARTEGEARKQVAADGEVLWDDNDTVPKTEPGTVGDKPEIDRIQLRNLLLDSVQPDTVRWGMKLQKVVSGEGATYDLHFTDTTERGFDLVVGADGAWSKIRSVLTETMPYYSGISAVELWAMDVDNKHPWLSKYVGSGSCFMFDEGRALLCQRNGSGNVRVYACVRKPEDWIKECGIDWSQPEKARMELVESCFSDCGEDLKKMIYECNDGMLPRAMYMLPVGIRWESRPGATLIGDGAHLMTPFAGVGVNIAMRDALDLANSIAAHRDNLFEAVKQYESGMFERGRRYAQKTAEGLEGHFSADGGRKRVETFKRRLAAREAVRKG